MDWSTLTRAEVWNALQSIGTVVTAVIAYFVYREARSIRRIEWAFHAVGKWQEFNRFLVETGSSNRWEQIRAGLALDPPLGPTDKRTFLMYFNVQMIEFYLMQKGIVPKHALSTMQAELRMFAPYKEFLSRVLEDGGYDPGYVRFVKSSLG
jgi:hypothetical protein